MSPQPIGGRSGLVSKFLFQWEAADGLDGLGRLVARTGQVATFDRGGTIGAATARDRNGLVYFAGPVQPRFTVIGGVALLLLEGSRVNDALRSRDLTNAAWTKVTMTTAAITGADGVVGSGTRLTATGANSTAILAALVHGSQARAGSFFLKRVTGSGNVQITLDNGAAWTTVTLTAAYTQLSKTQTLANSQFGIRLVTSGDVVDVDFAQNEAGSVASSPIPTVAASVTRTVDAASFAIGMTAAQLAATGVTIYDDLITNRASGDADFSGCLVLGAGAVGGSNLIAVELDSSAVAPAVISGSIAGAGGNTSISDVNSSALTFTVGDRLERMLSISTAGVATLTVSKNAAAAVVGSTGAAGGWPAALGSQVLTLTDTAAARAGDMVRRSVRIAAFVQSLAYMRNG